MKHYEVITISQHSELTNPLGDKDSERCYDVDGKICFSSSVYEYTHRYSNVHAGSIDIIKKTLGENSDIKFLKDVPNTFDILVKEDYIKCNERTEISKKFIKTIDSPCSDEVQERYKEFGMNFTRSYYSDLFLW